MLTFTAIDPGVHCVGWAKFNAGSFLSCGLLQSEKSIEDSAIYFAAYMRKLGNMYVIEVPQIYTPRKMKGDPNDLINVALVAGAIGGASVKTKYVRPHTWKGSIPKTKNLQDYIIHKRNLKTLQGVYLQQYVDSLKECPVALRHNIVDAVGIGLWNLTVDIK